MAQEAAQGEAGSEDMDTRRFCPARKTSGLQTGATTHLEMRCRLGHRNIVQQRVEPGHARFQGSQQSRFDHLFPGVIEVRGQLLRQFPQIRPLIGW
jgi:hypothetical protein